MQYIVLILVEPSALVIYICIWFNTHTTDEHLFVQHIRKQCVIIFII